MMFVQLLINTTFYYISVFERKKKLYIKLLFYLFFWGIMRIVIKFNAESKHEWVTFTHFYCSSTEEQINYYEQTFGNESVNEFIETHPMIDDILKEFERDKERIAREIQRQKDYKRSYNIY